jgi:beta-xylosidase
LQLTDRQLTETPDRIASDQNSGFNFSLAAAEEIWNSQTRLKPPIKSLVDARAESGNPLFPGADPDVIIADKKYWIYPTADDNSNTAIYVHSSSDLTNWKTSGPVLNLSDVSWANKDGAPWHQLWAPGIVHENNKYYLYFSVGPQNPTPSRIGVAVSDTPDGHFVDLGKPLITRDNGFEAIDPMIFKDPKTGDHYLYCGGSAGSKLHVYKLNPDMSSVDKEIPVDNPQDFTEGAFMHYRNGIYYMSYSHGHWNQNDYEVCYSTASSPTGPWTFKGPILQSNDEHLGPGHHAFLQNPASGQWYIVYHRWEHAGDSGKWPPNRSVAIDKLEYDLNGNIIPIKMTDTGVDASPAGLRFPSFENSSGLQAPSH